MVCSPMSPQGGAGSCPTSGLLLTVTCRGALNANTRYCEVSCPVGLVGPAWWGVLVFVSRHTSLSCVRKGASLAGHFPN